MSLRRIVAFLIALAILALVPGCGGEPVPDLIGRRLIMSSSVLEREGFVLGEVRYDEDVPESVGTIVDQRPRPGSGARPGSLVQVTVAGKELVRVPRLVGKPYDEARQLVESSGLRRGRVTDRFDTRFPEGIVIEQNLVAGTSLPQDTRVDVVVSLGPRTTMVPGVVGRDSKEAREFLRDLEFAVRQQFEHSPRPVGEVLAQYPDARAEVLRGEQVRLTVSRGPVMRMMPDVEGLAVAQALKELGDLGLKVTTASSGGAIVILPGSVVAKQEPLPGKLIPAGVTVILRTEVR
ncbi:MAG: PASTA domain-containing protein [Actinobacteria bacterium]|nr:PASTA domain-containing protein [Actinomycetota bacterium]MCG2807548.1 PASTA domain-containing protein [Coriobacteriia bacterium]